MHEDEIAIDGTLVRRLVDGARPEFADRSLRPLEASGSTNALFRLGADLLVRLPRQPGGSDTIAKEARWLPHLAAALPVAVPEVVAVGEPDFGYPEQWSIVRWIDGQTPDPAMTTERTARDLAAVVGALREAPVPAAALDDPALCWYRGAPVAVTDVSTRRNLADCRRLSTLELDLDACERVWDAAMALPAPAVESHWLHGDLLAENLLVQDDRLAGVIDFGALTVGDPTVDLIVAWEVLNSSERAVFRSVLDVDEVTWLRGRAWALAIAVMTFPYYWQTMPERCTARLAMARAVLDDAA